MNDKLKNTIQWTVYVLVMIVICYILVSLGANTVAPVFWPEIDVSSFTEYINNLCVMLSFASVALGTYSIWQASRSGKQASEMINSLHELKSQQALLVTLLSTKDSKVATANGLDGSWKIDDITK